MGGESGLAGWYEARLMWSQAFSLASLFMVRSMCGDSEPTNEGRDSNMT